MATTVLHLASSIHGTTPHGGAEKGRLRFCAHMLEAIGRDSNGAPGLISNKRTLRT